MLSMGLWKTDARVPDGAAAASTPVWRWGWRGGGGGGTNGNGCTGCGCACCWKGTTGTGKGRGSCWLSGGAAPRAASNALFFLDPAPPGEARCIEEDDDDDDEEEDDDINAAAAAASAEPDLPRPVPARTAFTFPAELARPPPDTRRSETSSKLARDRFAPLTGSSSDGRFSPEFFEWPAGYFPHARHLKSVSRSGPPATASFKSSNVAWHSDMVLKYFFLCLLVR
jgi:hypothetical protein